MSECSFFWHRFFGRIRTYTPEEYAVFATVSFDSDCGTSSTVRLPFPPQRNLLLICSLSISYLTKREPSFSQILSDSFIFGSIQSILLLYQVLYQKYKNHRTPDGNRTRELQLERLAILPAESTGTCCSNTEGFRSRLDSGPCM